MRVCRKSCTNFMAKQNGNEVLQTSACGEYLTAAELCARGWQVCMSPHQPSFDIAAVKGRKVQRVQVKTCAKPAKDVGKLTARYSFFPKCRRTNGLYTREECDFLIFVGLEHRAFFILPVEAATATKYNWAPGQPECYLAPFLQAWQLLEK